MATPRFESQSQDAVPYHTTGKSRLPATGKLTGVARVRHELLTALHFGKLTPGDRVPSIRALAEETGLNRKTVHRAYRLLAAEGVLDPRPGNGTFISDSLLGQSGTSRMADLLAAANRCRATAASLGLTPGQFASFLQVYLGPGLREVPLAVAECNHEQLALIRAGLQAQLGIRTRPVLLSQLAARPAAAIRNMHGVVTTDCHLSEVVEIIGSRDVPVYRVALDPRFPRQLLERAEDATVIMLIRDQRFIPVFMRLLRQIADSPRILERVHIVQPPELARLVREVDGHAWVYVSPLVQELTRLRLPSRFKRVRTDWRIEPGSLDRLQARLSLDLVTSNGGLHRLAAG